MLELTDDLLLQEHWGKEDAADHFALRPQKRDGLLGTGTEGEGQGSRRDQKIKRS